MGVFRITFTDPPKPLVIIVAEKPCGKKWCTSRPQTRPKEDEEVGAFR